MSKMRFLTMFGVTVLIFLLGSSVQAERQVVINIPAFTLYLYDQGVPVKSYPISIGTELNPSILGETTIINKVVDPTYYPPSGATPIPPGPQNPVGSRWLGLGFPGYGIHGTNNPNSIGSAASSGCIRMLNADVEELTGLVKVGTPVRLVYQTVLVQEDPILHTKTITVYPDVYKQGVSPLQLQSELERQQWGEVFWPALITLLRTPTGQPHPLAWAVPLRFNDKPTGLDAVIWGEHYYLPFDSSLDPRLSFIEKIVQWGQHYYLPLEQYLKLTGLAYSEAQGELILHSPEAYLEEIPLGKALVYGDEIYVIPRETVHQLIPEQMKALILWGDIYLPASALHQSPGELRLEWPEEVSY